jgi:prolyl-tRNA synthetase
MGCYGIGVSRIVAAAIEQQNDEKGIIFPSSISPFEIILTPIGYDKSDLVNKSTNDIYSHLIENGIDVLLDDRGFRPGVMFSESELLGIPHRITISEKTLAEDKLEYKHRASPESEYIALNSIIKKLQEY